MGLKNRRPSNNDRNQGNDFVYDPKRESSMNVDDSDQFEDESSYSSSGSSGHSNSTDDYPTQTTGLGDAKDDAFADNLAKKLTRDVKVWRSIVQHHNDDIIVGIRRLAPA